MHRSDQPTGVRPPAQTGPATRIASVRALGAMASSSLLRLLREGLVVRALLWPGLVTALSLVGSATATIAWRSNPSVASSVPELEPVLREAGFRVVATPDAEADLRSGRAERAVWREQDAGSQRVVLGSTWGGLLTLRLEGALRDALGERWRLEAASLPRREADNEELGRVTGILAAVVGLLFTLYGVAIGAGSLHRDRVGGLLECELAAAVPRGFHAAVLDSGALPMPVLEDKVRAWMATK